VPKTIFDKRLNVGLRPSMMKHTDLHIGVLWTPVDDLACVVRWTPARPITASSLAS
jgi:hypothetical protein